MLDYTFDNAVIHIETDHLKARIHTEGYVSGVAAGTLLDKATDARNLGFGLSVVKPVMLILVDDVGNFVVG